MQVGCLLSKHSIVSDSSTPRRRKVTDTSKVPELLKNLKKRPGIDDSDDEIEPAVAALSMIEQDEHIEKCMSQFVEYVLVAYFLSAKCRWCTATPRDRGSINITKTCIIDYGAK